jgi:hypothetical protein
MNADIPRFKRKLGYTPWPNTILNIAGINGGMFPDQGAHRKLTNERANTGTGISKRLQYYRGTNLPDRPGHRPRGADYHQLQQERWSLEGAWPSISWQLGEEQQRQTENHCSYKERHHGESHHSAETDAGYGQDR